MKRCPTCNREFEDSITYCLDDGSPLVSESRPDSEATLVNPSSRGRDIPPTQYGGLPGKATVSASQFDTDLISTFGATPERRVWPWVVAGIAVVFLVGVVIAAVIAIPKIVGTSKNSNRAVATKSPAPDQANARTSPESSADTEAPADESEVLSQLTELERQWTVANLEGDKDALDQILADDYRGGNPPHSKQEYLDAIRPDPTVKSWEFQDLRLDLDGRRASLDGYLRQETTRGVEVYSFTDEFVWRDGRWQATGSRTTRVK